MAYSVAALTTFNLHMSRIKTPLFLAALLFLSMACGQRGPLYLSDEESRQKSGQAEQTEQQEAPAKTDQDEDEGEEPSAA